MPIEATRTEHNRRIAAVIDYMFKHPAEDLSVDTLAGVAHYSPDHLQKLFKQIAGETPKQYSLKLQMETAFLFLMIHPGRPIGEVAAECGFSSPAAFSRAIKNYWGHSPERLRALPHKDRMTILHKAQAHHPVSASPPGTGAFPAPDIQIVQREKVQGIYQLTAFNDPGAIRKAFQALTQFARARGVEAPSLAGILSPLRRNSYRAFMAYAAAGEHPFPTCEIPGGTFASFSVGRQKATGDRVRRLAGGPRHRRSAFRV